MFDETGIYPGMKYPVKKDFTERLVELIKEDKELHDAAIRLIDSLTELNKEKAIRMKERRTHIGIVR